jgi:hypothetical protein
MAKGGSAPDITGAAKLEGEFGQRTARDQAYVQNADQYNALGSSTWTQELVADPASRNRYQNQNQNQNQSSDQSSDQTKPFRNRSQNSFDYNSGIRPSEQGSWDGYDYNTNTRPSEQVSNSSGGSTGSSGGFGDDGMVTKWINNQTLSAPMQQQFDTQNSTNQNLADAANAMGSQVRQDMGTPANFDQFGQGQSGPVAKTTSMSSPSATTSEALRGPSATTGNEQFSYDSNNRGRAEDAAYQKATNRLDPRMEKERATLERQLTNRGLRAGDSAFDSAMSNFGNQSNDAYEQARLGSVSQGRMEDQQSYGQAQGTFGTNRASEQQQFNQEQQAFGTDRATEQQRFNQEQQAFGTDRATEQQAFNQSTQATNQANALRSQNIQEYLGKRGQSLKDQNALRAANTTGDVINSFGSGG